MMDYAFPEAHRTKSDTAVDWQRQTALLGESDAFRYLLFRVNDVAPTSATILLLGETGTGKTLIAREIHQRSAQRAGRFVAVNCAALPATLLESELFGHERGAFTDAKTTQIGRLELADRGTIFLDEVGELPLESQAKLLRFLHDGEFERLGSARTVRVRVRVITATNRDLEEEVRQGRFRRDLFFRLSVFPVTVPPLRERRRDIRLLALHFIDRLSRRESKRFDEVPEAVLTALERHHWPGNVRELENVLERAVITSRSGTLRLDDTATLARRRTGQRSHGRCRAVAPGPRAVARGMAGRGSCGSVGYPGAAPEHAAQPDEQAWHSPPRDVAEVHGVP